MAQVRLNDKIKVGVVIHEVSRLRRKAIDKVLLPLGITGTQWWLLTYVSLRPGLSQARLADELNLGKVAIGGLIERLMKNDLLDRRPDQADKRVNLIFLSDAGIQLVKEISRVSASVQDKALEGILPDELAVAVGVMMKMQANLEAVLDIQPPEGSWI